MLSKVFISRCLLVLLLEGQKSLSLSSRGSGFFARWLDLLGEISMLSSSTSSSSSSSSSSSRSISLSPDSSCREAHRVHDQFSSRVARHLCQLRSKGWCLWLTWSCFLPYAWGHGDGHLFVWTATDPDLDLPWTAADSARGFVLAHSSSCCLLE